MFQRVRRVVLAALAALSLTVSFGAAAIAQDTDENSTLRDQREEQRMENRERLNEVRKERIARHWANMARKFERAIGRLERIADRVESRIDKFEEKGADVSASRANLEEARTHIARTKGTLQSAETAAGELGNSDDPKAAFTALREQVQSVKTELRAAHRLLVESIKILKGVSTANPQSSSQPPSDSDSGN